ncbi:hypothetical protein Poly30_07980 [Planctomycetes bacterium Poly30]|uniref:Arrestin-like N-terminal domain-containing protein n=1 Tax=Saltatorellus ferox TaxID=2528018 RepID=A0A518EMI4_9BACT|nr:hypothetical protein Poly30_07980 [Planctomycetes bacterium Poly30]
MAKCSLRIELPEARDFVEPGGQLDVIVHVDCDARTKCNGLTLTRLWRTHGMGNRDTGDKRVEELFRGEWEPGTYAYPATIEFPHGPTSYHGKAINIDWYLVAEADVPFAFDPKAEEMVLMADPRPPRGNAAPSIWAPGPVKMSTNLGGCLIPSYIGLGVAAVLLATGTFALGAVLGVVSAWLLLGSLRAGSTVKALGHVAMEIHPSEVAPGEAFHVMLELKPGSSVELNLIKLTLTSTERATSGSGTTAKVHKQVAFHIEEVVAEDLRLVASDRFDQETTFQLPVTAPVSFKASNNEIKTTLTLSIHPAKKTPVTHEAVLQVVPSPGA